MEAHLLEWLNLSVRWVHMITGVAWIGASFYFVWLENNLNRVNPKNGLAGDLWAIHGGGIYHLEKYKLAPPTMPDNLHWFKWEAYFTWMSGVALLCVVFYLNPTLYLLAPGSSLSGTEGVLLGIGSLFAGWFIYSFLCDSALGKRPALLGLILFVLLIAAAYGFSKVFSGRGAYLHVGAVIGTIMVGNVFRIIMPAQRALVAAIAENRTPDPALPAKGLLRSRHNNYFTLPVLFIMISNHFAMTYRHAHAWAVLGAIMAAGVFIRHFFNLRHKGRVEWRYPAIGVLILLGVFVALMPEPPGLAGARTSAGASQVQFAQVQTIIAQRCVACHAAHPTQPGFASAPAGVMLDDANGVKQNAARIYQQAVQLKAMPLANMTNMTDAERAQLAAWYEAGAHTQ